MAQTVVEQMETRKLSSSGGRLSGSRVFVVWDDATLITTPNGILFDGSTSMPRLGDLFPGEIDVYAVSFAISPIERSNGIWRVEWTYGTGGADGVPDSQSADVGYLQVSFALGGGFREVWRANPNVNVTLNNDIGGVSIDCAGEPTSLFVPQNTLTVSETVTAASLIIRASAIRTFVANRNASEFFGAQTNTLLYMGCSGSRVSSTAYTLTHNFIYDPWHHKIQQPKKNQLGKVEFESGGFNVASIVRWVQPFPTLGEFKKLSENF